MCFQVCMEDLHNDIIMIKGIQIELKNVVFTFKPFA